MRFNRFFCAMIPILAWWASGTSDPVAYAFEAGAAKVDITPPVGTPLNGYGDRMGRSSTSVHDPLWSRALYLDDGQTQLFLVNLDLCVVDKELRARVLELAPGDVPKEHIILTATHTHNGAGGMCKQFPLRFVSGRYMPEIVEATARKVVQSMLDAYQNRRRAAIGFGTGQQNNLSRNRRQDNGLTDPQIGVIAVEDADGNPIAIITNLAAHPTSISDEPVDHYAFSADYPGFYYAELERLESPGCVAMFLNGAEGNQTVGNPEDKGGWERTESAGRVLAARAKEIADGITCGDAKLHVGFASPALPKTIAPFMPSSVLLMTLEINDLLMTFIPGEACVEIALQLRQNALARGYQAQFTIGLSNDYLMYFAPRKYYPLRCYESAISSYGPRIEDWFYTEFDRLMTKGEPVAEPPEIPAAAPEETEGGLRLALSGTPYQMGVQRGKAFAQDITARYQDRIFTPVSNGALRPAEGVWAAWPSFLDPAPLALPIMAMAARPLTEGLPETAFQEIEGIADGAGLPFDAVWLLQNAMRFSLQEDKTPLFQTPLCTMFAAVGDRAGADDLFVGRNLDWADAEIPVILEMRPENARRYVQVGFTWNAGVFTGMNDAGLVVCAERIPALGIPSLTGPPVEMVLRDLLETMEFVTPAVAKLQSCAYLRGYNVLVAGMDTKNPKAATNGKPGAPAKVAAFPKAAVLSFGGRITAQEANSGLLWGVDLASNTADADTASRYARAAAMLENERIIGRREIQQVLADQEPEKTGLAAIWNDQTRHSVIFEPGKRLLHVAFRGSGNGPGAYTTISLKGEPAHE